jgi:integrase
MSTYLKLRNGRFSFRLRVPRDCRAQLGVEITRDLGTAVRRDADRIARRLAVEYKGLFAAIRACANLGQELADAKGLAREVAGRHLTRLQTVPEAHRRAEGTPSKPEEAHNGGEGSMRAETASAQSKRPSGSPSIPKSLEDVLASLLTEKTARGQWRNGTRQQSYRYAERFVEYVGFTKPVTDVDRSDILRWLGSRRTPDGRPLAPTTHNNEVAAVGMLLGHAQLNRWISWNPAQDLRRIDPRASHERRDALTLDELQRLFSKEFLAWASYSRSGKWWAARRYVPLLMAAAGMRLKEAAQLAVEDVFESPKDGIWVARVTHDVDEQGRTHGRRSVKNRSSRREIPLHPEVLRLGLIDFVLRRKAEVRRPSDPLFAEMAGKHAVASLSLSANTVLLPKVGVKRETTSIYSLRHSFTTAMEHEGVPLLSAKQFVGHTLGSDAHFSYVKPREVSQLADDVFPALDRWLPEVFKNLNA